MVWNELKYKCHVKKELGEIPVIQCYPGQLNQVFMNLFMNAVQSISEKGEISISTSATEKEIVITISDTGIGIPKENLTRIFDPFFTTKPVGIGTGLGLAISAGIIKKHLGTINVYSVVDKGSTFTISLPVVNNLKHIRPLA
jgi:signal transduction histidine kinase